MRLTRCHVELALRAGDELVLPEHAAAHLARVLRLREPGDPSPTFMDLAWSMATSKSVPAAMRATRAKPSGAPSRTSGAGR